jgi:predicted house-cleaning noncanonical NTP pyrophosphatase (MazG superfamily)
MNPLDRDNLNFIMTASAEELREFYDDMNTENLLYLLNLVRGEMSRLRLEEVELLDEVTHTDDADRAILEILEKFDTK